MHAACLTAHAFKLRPFNAVKPPVVDHPRYGHNIIDLSKRTLFKVPNNWFPIVLVHFEPLRKGQPIYQGHNS